MKTLISLVVLFAFATSAPACPPGFAFRAAVDPGCGCGVNVPAPVAPLARFSYSAQVDPVPVLPRAQFYASGGCGTANLNAQFDPFFAQRIDYRAGVRFDPYFRSRFRGGFHGHVGGHVHH